MTKWGSGSCSRTMWHVCSNNSTLYVSNTFNWEHTQDLALQHFSVICTKQQSYYFHTIAPQREGPSLFVFSSQSPTRIWQTISESNTLHHATFSHSTACCQSVYKFRNNACWKYLVMTGSSSLSLDLCTTIPGYSYSAETRMFTECVFFLQNTGFERPIQKKSSVF